MILQPHPTESTPNSSTNPLALVAHEMARVDQVIQQRLSSDVPLVGQVAHYIIGAGGKRVRPALLLLMCQVLGCTDPRRHALAAVVEFIHTATLLHDDVVDESTLRRGRDTANQIFGNAASVLVGDFLYSRAFQMMVQADNVRVMQTLAEATNVIAEGEVLQLMHTHNPDLDEAAYLKVIRAKTAKLFEASARLAAIVADSDPATEAHCAAYGQALGAAFQVVDDVLDYTGDAATLGKNLGDDLREGKMTLPIICTLQRCSGPDAALIRQAIEQGNTEQLDRIVHIVKQSGALQEAQDAARAEAQRAIDAAAVLPQGPATRALLQWPAILLERSF